SPIEIFQVHLASPKGQFYVGFLGFINPQNLNFTGQCCDGPRTETGCLDSCDLIFEVSLKGIDSVPSRPSEHPIDNAKAVFFPTSLEGVTNPLTFTFRRWPGQVNITVDVYDIDDNNGSSLTLIDMFLFNFEHEGPSLDFIYMHEMGMRSHDPSELRMVFRYGCDPSYYGQNCAIDCLTYPDSQHCPDSPTTPVLTGVTDWLLQATTPMRATTEKRCGFTRKHLTSGNENSSRSPVDLCGNDTVVNSNNTGVTDGNTPQGQDTVTPTMSNGASLHATNSVVDVFGTQSMFFTTSDTITQPPQPPFTTMPGELSAITMKTTSNPEKSTTDVDFQETTTKVMSQTKLISTEITEISSTQQNTDTIGIDSSTVVYVVDNTGNGIHTTNTNPSSSKNQIKATELSTNSNIWAGTKTTEQNTNSNNEAGTQTTEQTTNNHIGGRTQTTEQSTNSNNEAGTQTTEQSTNSNNEAGTQTTEQSTNSNNEAGTQTTEQSTNSNNEAGTKTTELSTNSNNEAGTKNTEQSTNSHIGAGTQTTEQSTNSNNGAGIQIIEKSTNSNNEVGTQTIEQSTNSNNEAGTRTTEQNTYSNNEAGTKTTEQSTNSNNEAGTQTTEQSTNSNNGAGTQTTEQSTNSNNEAGTQTTEQSTNSNNGAGTKTTEQSTKTTEQSTNSNDGAGTKTTEQSTKTTEQSTNSNDGVDIRYVTPLLEPTKPSTTTAGLDPTVSQDPMEYWPAIVGGVLGALVLMAIIAFILYYRKQKAFRRQEIYNVNPKRWTLKSPLASDTTEKSDVTLETEQI
ncbi:uncharacterized protein, partial [Argopecten irradians]|uniref:uncharacterized protein n=1 Tax=Argopecten irradians TaxID=31199 RepID=UPI00371A80F0